MSIKTDPKASQKLILLVDRINIARMLIHIQLLSQILFFFIKLRAIRRMISIPTHHSQKNKPPVPPTESLMLIRLIYLKSRSYPARPPTKHPEKINCCVFEIEVLEKRAKIWRKNRVRKSVIMNSTVKSHKICTIASLANKEKFSECWVFAAAKPIQQRALQFHHE